jgi:hypothetical protein
MDIHPSTPWMQGHKVNFNFVCDMQFGVRGGAVVEALRYKAECRGIDSRCVTGIFH